MKVGTTFADAKEKKKKISISIYESIIKETRKHLDGQKLSPLIQNLLVGWCLQREKRRKPDKELLEDMDRISKEAQKEFEREFADFEEFKKSRRGAEKKKAEVKQ